MSSTRFSDKNFRLADFYDEVWVICPECERKALAHANREEKTARLSCTHCGYSRDVSTRFGKSGSITMAAHGYFDVKLWLSTRFRNNMVWAYNDKHLAYLKAYVAASLREHKDRTGFTLLEKLPRFYHEARNREALLKVLEKLEQNQE